MALLKREKSEFVQPRVLRLKVNDGVESRLRMGSTRGEIVALIEGDLNGG